MNYTSWFADEAAADIKSVGGKGTNLSLLFAEGFPVPPGFCIQASAYRYLLQVTGLDQVIRKLAKKIDHHNQEDVVKKTTAIRDLFEQQPIPIEIAAEILDNYHSLGRRVGCRHLEATPVAVRSSATAEDLPEASIIGQQDSYLNVRGGLSLLEHVRHCWASLCAANAVTCRCRQQVNDDYLKVSAAVVVQAMINPDVSGVLLTANPLTGDSDQCVIYAGWGLGQAINSGVVNTDTLVVDKVNGRIIQQKIATKDWRVVFSPREGVQEEDVPRKLRKRCALQPEQAAQLAALATRIEQYFGFPQEIEWASESCSWYILQARPITTLQDSQPIANQRTDSRKTTQKRHTGAHLSQ